MNRKTLRLARRAKANAQSRALFDEFYTAVGALAFRLGQNYWSVQFERSTGDHQHGNRIKFSGYIHGLTWESGKSIAEVVERLKNAAIGLPNASAHPVPVSSDECPF